METMSFGCGRVEDVKGGIIDGKVRQLGIGEGLCRTAARVGTPAEPSVQRVQ